MSSKTKSRNRLLLSNHKSNTGGSATRDELLRLKYLMIKPDLPVYTLDDTTTTVVSTPRTATEPKITTEPTYPDFTPWKDLTQVSEQKESTGTGTKTGTGTGTGSIDQSRSQVPPSGEAAEKEHVYFNKGYAEAPQVNNEYYSARNFLQSTLLKSNDNCNTVISELSQHLTNSFRSRNEVINRIKSDSAHFRLPQRVTLTAAKRDMWLTELSNPNIPLQKIGEKIPHGMKNKTLIDAVITKKIPIDRALWLTKCILYGEIIALRRKIQSRLNLNGGGNGSVSGNTGVGVGSSALASEWTVFEKYEIHWFHDWTQQVTEYIFKFSKEMNSITNHEYKGVYMSRLSYLLDYVQHLYIEALVDPSYFQIQILKPFRDNIPKDKKLLESITINTNQDDDEADNCEDGQDEKEVHDASDRQRALVKVDFSQTLFALTLLKIFWKDLLQHENVIKEVAELLLLNYMIIANLVLITGVRLPQTLGSKLTGSIKDLIVYLFKHDVNIFVIPESWHHVESLLNEILLLHLEACTLEQKGKLLKQLDLIKFRNESLVLNTKGETGSASGSGSEGEGEGVLGNDTHSPKDGASLLTTSIRHKRESSSNAALIINNLDNGRLNDKMAEMFLPYNNGNFTVAESSFTWKQNLSILIVWCCTKWRSRSNKSEEIQIACSFLEKSISKIGLDRYQRNELENEILENIFALIDDKEELIFIDQSQLYCLINELYRAKICSVSSYMRKLISSGVLSSPELFSDDEQIPMVIQAHLNILQCLPVENNRQRNNLLKKWRCGTLEPEKLQETKQLFALNFIDRIAKNEDILSHINDLSNAVTHLTYGSKIQLTNLFAKELNAVFKRTTKLIRLSPTIVYAMYLLHKDCNNLLAFFKFVVPTILKNESGIIFLHHNALYLVARLVMKHFRLIKQFSSYSETSALTLFLLILQNYREAEEYSSYYNFEQVWNFMDHAISRTNAKLNLVLNQDHNQKRRKVDNNSIGTNDSVQSVPPTVRSTSEFPDTPMRINVEDISNTTMVNANAGSQTINTADDFFESLANLRRLSSNYHLENDSTSFSSQHLSLSVDELLESWILQNSPNSKDYNVPAKEKEEKEIQTVQLLKLKLANESASDEDNNNANNNANNKSVVNLKENIIFKMKNLLNQVDNSEQRCAMLKKLVIYDIVSVGDIIKIMFSLDKAFSINYKLFNSMLLNSGSGSSSGYENNLYSNFNSDKNQFISPIQQELFDIAVGFYKRKNRKEFFHLILKSLTSDGPLFTNDLMINHEFVTLEYLRDILARDASFLNESLFAQLSRDDSIELLNLLLGRNNNNYILSLEGFENEIRHLNEFNIGGYQILVALLSKLLDVVDLSVRKLRWEQFVAAMLNCSEDFQKSSSNTDVDYNDERIKTAFKLFEFVSWDQKAILLEVFEEVFLSQGNDVRGENQGVVMLSKPRLLGIDLFFTNFIYNSSHKIGISENLINSISNFVKSMLSTLDIAKSEMVLGDRSREYLLATLFKILIIHRESLCNTLSSSLSSSLSISSSSPSVLSSTSSPSSISGGACETLVGNLIEMLLARYLAEPNNKWKVLLFDMLSLMKLSISTRRNSLTNIDLATSPNLGSTPNEFHPVATSNVTTTVSAQIGTLFELPKMKDVNELKSELDDDMIRSIIMLDLEELKYGGDVSTFNDPSLVIDSTRRDVFAMSPFVSNLLSVNKSGDYQKTSNDIDIKPFQMKSYEIIEDTTVSTVNDACLNLLLFDSYLTRENPV